MAVLLAPASSWPHGGEDHGDAPAPTVQEDTRPRAETSTEWLELVLRLDGDALVVYLDDYNTNAPIAGAEVEVEGNGLKGVAVERSPGVYALDAGPVKAPGTHPLTLSIISGDQAELLTASFTVPKPEEAEPSGDQMASSKYALWAGAGGVLVMALILIAVRQSRRGKTSQQSVEVV